MLLDILKITALLTVIVLPLIPAKGKKQRDDKVSSVSKLSDYQIGDDGNIKHIKQDADLHHK